MSFKSTRLITLVACFLLSIFFLFIGGGSLILPWSSALQTRAIEFISHEILAPSLWGLAFIALGASLATYLYLNIRRQYVQIRTGELGITLNKDIIHQYLETYWKEHFPTSDISFTLNFKKHALEIAVDFPPLPHLEQKQILEEVKNDLGDLFGRVLGYPFDVHLIASFHQRHT